MEIEGGAVDGGLIDLEVTSVNDDADRCADGEGDAVDGAVRDRDEFDFVRADLDQAAGKNFAESGGIEEAGFFEALFDEGERKARAINRNIQIAENVGEGADMIFVAVGQDNGTDVLAILLEVGDVGDDEVDAEELGFGEHHAGIDDEDIVTETKDHHVHSKFAETAEGDCE